MPILHIADQMLILQQTGIILFPVWVRVGNTLICIMAQHSTVQIWPLLLVMTRNARDDMVTAHVLYCLVPNPSSSLKHHKHRPCNGQDTAQNFNTPALTERSPA